MLLSFGNFLLLGILLLFTNTLLADEVMEISLQNNFKTINPTKYFQIFEDKEGSLTFTDILKEEEHWNKPKNENCNFGFSYSVFWVRFTLSNPTQNTVRPIIEFGFPRQDYIELFSPKNDKYASNITGDNFQFEQRGLADAHFAFELALLPNTKQTYYIKTSSFNNLSFLNPSLHKSYDSFHQESSYRILSNSVIYGFLFIMAFYNLFLFFMIKERVYLYLTFYVITFNYLLACLHGTAFQYIYPNYPILANRDAFMTVPLLMIFQILLANGYLELKKNSPRIYLLLKSYTIFLFLYGLSINTILVTETKFIYYSANSLIFLNSLICISIGLKLSIKKFRPAYFYLVSWSILLIAFILRALAAASIIPLNPFTFWSFQIGLAFMLVLISIGLADKINYLKRKLQKSNKQLEDYSEHLEEKISERTEELQSTLNTVSKLKTQQDGDYFLTSLLIEPFIINTSSSKNVKVDFLLIQKKKFDFYGKEQQIGGDLCHSQNIVLSDKNYILFFNSDSMGKSLQGAGGAIVFGSVFFSIIERTKSSVANKNLSPERWLKNVFIELHKVFLTFDCTMLVSAVIGLVEEDTGVLYFINSEHPLIALYADNVCLFIEREIHFTKFGSPVASNKLFVSLYQLHKNDSIFIGSDGRDDFALGDLTLNQDENEFLNTVMQAEGDLKKIYEITCKKGQVIDDFSLMRINFLHEISTYERIKNLSIENFDSNNFTEALLFAEEYISKNPMDSDFLFFLGNLYFQKRNYKKAIEYFERLRLRNPYHIENLLALCESLTLVGSLRRAEKILSESEKIDTKHPKILQLNETLSIELNK